MTDKHTIKDIENHTGLTFAYIDKCINRLKNFIEPHMFRGDNNARLFDSDGLVIFDKIKQMKEQGMAINEIKHAIEAGFKPVETEVTKPIESGTLTIETQPNEIIKVMQQYESKLELERKKVDEEKEKRITEQLRTSELIRKLEVEKEALTGALKMLPSGKTPEQIRTDWEEAEKKKIEIASIADRLSALSITQFIQRKRLLKRLKELSTNQ